MRARGLGAAAFPVRVLREGGGRGGGMATVVSVCIMRERARDREVGILEAACIEQNSEKPSYQVGAVLLRELVRLRAGP